MLRNTLGLLFVALLALVPAGAQETQPNFVILLADDLGINDLGCFGRKDQNTPNLDRLASEGTRFTQAYAAASVCSPSRASLLTGQNPARLNITTFLPGRLDRASQRVLAASLNSNLPNGVQTIAQLLKPKGYASVAVGKWHLGAKGHEPTDHGFDEYFEGKANPGAESPDGGKGELEHADYAVKFIERNKAKPFFLYLAFDNPHIPLAASGRGIEANAKSFNPTYAAVVESLDVACGRVLKALEDNGLSKNTLVVFASDNGGLHVSEGKDSPPTYNAPSRAGKGYLYEGGIRTPLIIRYPGRLASRVISVPVVLGDLCPTICALAKVPAPSPLDFQDLSTLLFDSKPPASAKPRALFWHQPHYMNQGGKPGGVVREGDWKLIEQYEDGSLELFNIAKDPSEATDLAAAEPARVAAMRGMLEKWRRSVGAEPVKANPNFSRALWENCFVKTDASRLEALPTSEAMRPMLTDWRTAMNNVKVEGPNALIFLESRDAMVKATTLKYEDEPEKDTLGFWINAEDTASWTFQAPKAGEYRVTVLQGCGKGEGGSVVALDTTQGTCEFTVEDTGHFQRFIPCEVGKLRLVAGENTLTVRPVKLAKTAVMDLRRVILEGVE
ncbi:MAG: sulfatase-like hydrolase/transferase [Akkermansiaceae bacterium]|nr:sulfatase-like hydrolase/transferase [Akkermansiaceae bacterium]